jgi:hypothetical protein
MMFVRDISKELEQLRMHRVPPERDLSISGLVAEQARYAQQTRAQLGQMIDLWYQLVPTDLRYRSAIRAFKRGVLTVEADSASVRFELDRRLREGLTDEFRRHFHGTLRQVKVRLADGDDDAPMAN